MTVKEMFADILFMCVFLVIGFGVRELVKPLKKIYLPASVIGGAVLLIFGQQGFGLVTVPSSFSSFSSVLIDLIMCALVFGITFSIDKVKSYGDYCCVAFSMYGWQIAVGAILGILLTPLWPGLPKGWGIMGPFCFYGGHGTAASAGAAFEQLGIEGNTDLGMIFSTIGMLSAMTIGMLIVNIGIRKGQTTFMRADAGKNNDLLKTFLPKESQKSLGYEKVSPIAINGFAFQLALLGTALFIGRQLFAFLKTLHPFFGTLPSMLHGIVGGLILWFIISKIGLKELVDRRTVSTISGFLLEIVIITAISTIKLSIITTYWIPITIYSVVQIALTIFIVFFFAKKFCRKEWFEKALMIYGMGTGSTATGLALVRTVDPQAESCAGDAHGVFATLNVFAKVAPAILPTLILSSVAMVIGIGAAFGILALIVGALLFCKRSTKGNV